MTYRLAACPKCQTGTLALDQDGYACISCGYVQYSTAPLPWVRDRRGQGRRVKGKRCC